MKTRILPADETVSAAAEHILACVAEKPDGVIAVSGGADELLVLRRAAELAAERGVSFDELKVFAACEFCGGEGIIAGQIRTSLSAAFRGGIFTPDGDDCAGYDGKIERMGGIDLAVLGLGDGASVAFNELATQYDSYTHVQKLSSRIKNEWADVFGGAENVPERGVTLGFQNICRASDIVVIALGERRSDAVFRMLYGRDDSVYPAAFLQLPRDVCLYADTDAAAKL